MKKPGTSINVEINDRSQAVTGVNPDPVTSKTQRPTRVSKRKYVAGSPSATHIDGPKPPTPKRSTKGSVEKWPADIISKLNLWVGRRVNRLRKYERAGVGQVISWAYIPEVEVEFFIENHLHKTMKYRTFTDQVSSYIKNSQELMTRIPTGASSEKKLTDEAKLEVIQNTVEWPKFYLEENFVDVTMTSLLDDNTVNHPRGKDLSKPATLASQDSAEKNDANDVSQDMITVGPALSNSKSAHFAFIENQNPNTKSKNLASKTYDMTTRVESQAEMPKTSTHLPLRRKRSHVSVRRYDDLGTDKLSLEVNNQLLDLTYNTLRQKVNVSNERPSVTYAAIMNTLPCDVNVDSKPIGPSLVNDTCSLSEVHFALDDILTQGETMQSDIALAEELPESNDKILCVKVKSHLEYNNTLDETCITLGQKSHMLSNNDEVTCEADNTGSIQELYTLGSTRVTSEQIFVEEVEHSANKKRCLHVKDSSNLSLNSTVKSHNHSLSMSNLSLDSVNSILGPSSDRKLRAKDRSKKHPRESTLTSSEKAALRKVDERRRLKLDPPKTTLLKRNINPKKPLFEPETPAEIRLQYYLKLKTLPKCNRWELNKWIPVNEIDLEGRRLLMPIIDKLRDDSLKQHEYASLHVSWVKIANAMMLTAASYDRSRVDLDGFTSGKPLITASRKRKERLLIKITSAWKSRMCPKTKGKNATGKTLRLARVQAQSKNINNITSYMNRLSDEVQHLRNKEERFKTLELERKARFLFNKKPSLKTVDSVFKKAEKATVLEKDCVQFFKKLYSKTQELATPEVDMWCDEWRNRPITADLDEVYDILQERLKYSSPFKAPGPNDIYPAAFKRFKSLQELLYAKVMAVLSGKVTTLNTEHMANAFLLPKTDDPVKLRSPTNYRVINCINSDIKYLNAVVYGLIYRNCYSYLRLNQSAAFKGMTGTLNAYVINATILRQHKKVVSCMYTDMQKAFDSVDQTSMMKIIRALNIPESIKVYIQQIMASASFKITNATQSNHRMKELAKVIRVERGVLQGCALAPCMFILCMDVISSALNKLPELSIGLNLNNDAEMELVDKFNSVQANVPQNNTMKRQQTVMQSEDPYLKRRLRLLKVNHISFVDDVKMFASCKENLKQMKDTFVKVGIEMGLKVNLSKCGVVPSIQEGVTDINDVEHLSTAYKYLGLPEIGRGIDINYLRENLADKVISKVARIYQSCLSTGQKVRLFNICIVPAVQYIVIHSTASVSMRRMIALCKYLDKCVLKVLSGSIRDNEVINLRQPTQSIARLHLTPEKGGLGMISLAEAAKKAIIAYGVNLVIDPIHKKSKNFFIKQSLEKKMSPISAFHTLMTQAKIKYTIGVNSLMVNEVCFVSVKDAKKAIGNAIDSAFQDCLYEKWTKHMDYAKLVKQEELKFPWLIKASIRDKDFNLIASAQQESLPGFSRFIAARENKRLRCPMCQENPTSSHLIGGCKSKTAEILYRQRHDQVVRLVANYFIKSAGRKHMSLNDLRDLCEDQDLGNGWCLSVDRPQLVEINSYENGVMDEDIEDRVRSRQFVHNRPDIIAVNRDKKEVLIIEIAVSNPHIMKVQREVKRVRYCVNGTEEISLHNYNQVSENMCIKRHLQSKYGPQYKVEFIPIIIGSYGEIKGSLIDDLQALKTLLCTSNNVDKLVEAVSAMVARETAKILKVCLGKTLSV